MTSIELAPGVAVPRIGFGTFQIWDQAAAESAVAAALGTGYRLIDTAAGYFNEEGVGRGLRASGVPRDQVVVTSKLWPTDASYEGAKVALRRSLTKLGLDYLDVYLLHQALGDYYGAWRAMQEAQAAGLVRAIGVSNFSAERLVDLATFSGAVPALNQIQRHPFKQQRLTVAAAASLGVAVEAWQPLGHADPELLGHPVLAGIAATHGATVGQVMLAWQMQQGVIVIPKTSHRARMEENLAAQALTLTAAEMAAIAALDRAPRDPGPQNSPDLIARLIQIDPAGRHQG
ncbi:aldo/keto reductase [Lacticaseibacillus kribbianus]|uniref:aldo/keto reductase n=1 Tax=Lacticaseibacillus kribbianus TaxID=2926292 RepID=UPI001CD69DEE|nr:aldo/keto reductase [Lacticaseibacillus kribbianus]